MSYPLYNQVEYEAGKHYEALETEDRILMPDVPALRGLRHKWFWEVRKCPRVPVWNFAAMPGPKKAHEENCRLLSVYMRPWTLHQADVTEQKNPMLTDLRLSLIHI